MAVANVGLVLLAIVLKNRLGQIVFVFISNLNELKILRFKPNPLLNILKILDLIHLISKSVDPILTFLICSIYTGQVQVT